MNPDGTERKQLTQYDGDIEGFAFSPDGKKLLFIAQVKTVQSTADKHPDLPKATGIIVTDLMYQLGMNGNDVRILSLPNSTAMASVM